MNIKKLVSAVSALTVAAIAFAGLAVTASAEGTTVVTPTMTYVNYDAADTAYGSVDQATSGYNRFSNGTVSMVNTSWGADYVTFLKVDASSITDTITSAVLSLSVSGSTDSKRTCTYGAYYTGYTAWDNTLTYNIANTNGMLSGTGVGSTVSTTDKSSTTFKDVTIDITDAFKNDTDKIVTIGIYETAAAGGYIKSPSVTIQSSSSSTDYTINAVADDTVLEKVASGSTTPSSTLKVSGIKEVIKKDGVFYRLSDSGVSSYSKSFEVGTEEYTGTVSYTATTDMDYYIEGETLGTAITSNITSSNGAYGAVGGGKTASIGTYPAGLYTLTFYLNERGDRGVFVRNGGNNDVATNVIAKADISKSSANGIYTVNFILTKETELKISGYTSNTTTNQSAGIDYLYLKKTGDYVAPSADAELAKDITGDSDAASVWTATVTGVEGVAFTKVKATAKAGDSTGTGSAALPAAFEGGLSAKIIVVVPKASANIDSVTVTLE